MAIHAYISFSFSYLNRARVLVSTLRQQHPDWVIWAVLTDKAPEGFSFDLASEDYDKVATTEELFGAETNPWLFGRDIVEACTAVKGRALRHILAQPDVEKVVYFDPDIAVFNTMDRIIDLLDDCAIILTPHQIDPESRKDKQAIMDNEVGSLDYEILITDLSPSVRTMRPTVLQIGGRTGCTIGAMIAAILVFLSTRNGAT